ncbi:aminotransferase class V-fold PLP-dependent enzyme [Egibacter rhizosphaerae]|uniref:Aminotransferase class V-fold PLP-dependent enzyme n=1 Tax=Egibacter rhizosphaerae TaxID=1670831 RepID=A0A411YL67_9ACTN|nr:aminotransferase class V-fold PLP-dependent enzyme [Egibacter rhizosphaerae]
MDPQRDAFELADDVAYLNTAYIGPLLRDVAAAGHAAIERRAAPWRIRPEDFFSEVERLRARTAELLERSGLEGATAEGVALVPSVSYGITTAARNVGLGAGRTVIVLEEQFPSNVYPWRELATDVGGRVVTVARPSDDDWAGAVERAIDERTDVVAVPPVHWTDGTRVDLARVGAAARAVGAALVVDATQALGAVSLPLAEAEPDFLVAACYKWLLGPYSLGILWAAPQRREGRPLEASWMAREGSDDFARVAEYRDDLRPGARRYDVGETANFTLVPMAVAAMERLLDWGVERIEATLAARTHELAAAASTVGATPPPVAARSSHMLGLSLPGGIGTEGLAASLADHAVHVSVRGAAVRVAPHLHTTDEDVARFREALAAAVARG